MMEVLEKTVLTFGGMTAKEHAQSIQEMLHEIQDTKAFIGAIQRKCLHKNTIESDLKDYYEEDEYGRSTGRSTKYRTCEDCGVRISTDYNSHGQEENVRFNYGEYEGDLE